MIGGFLSVATKFLPPWFRPWMALAAVIAVLTVLLGIQTVRLYGAQTKVAAEQAAHMATQRNYATAFALATKKARDTENDLRNELERIQSESAKEKEIAQRREEALVDSVRSGERRLRIAAMCSGGSGAGVNPGSSGGGGSSLQVAELDAATGERILRVGIDGDRYIRERNTCIAAYEAVRKRLNAAAEAR